MTALLLAAPMFGAATCADFGDLEPDDVSCVVDAECYDGAVCYRGLCTDTCASDDDCNGDVCSSEVRSETEDVVDVCVTQAGGQIDAECMTDTDCEDAFPGLGAQCGIDGVCFQPAFSLLIRDTTVAPSDMDGGFGADILAVYLADPETGEPVAWADTIEESVSVDNEPDGQPRALQADPVCTVDGFEDAAASLGGDGNYLLVRFLESDPRVTEMVVNTPPSTWNVVVVEWGDNCGATGDQDTFDVFACAAPSHKATDPARHCTELLGSAPNGGLLVIEPEQK